jgi:RNA polymerase sigma-70 factor (ECF subfamily)
MATQASSQTCYPAVVSEPAPTDLELAQRWGDGDERAGRLLFERHFDAIYRFFRNKIGDHADDLVQQTFLGVVRGKDRFRGDSSFRTYLFRIARNRLYTHLRDRGRRPGHDEFGEASVADLGMPSPTAAIAQRQEHRILLKAMRRLPVDLQVALELHYWERLTVREIAIITETPEGTIKRRLQRARAKLDELVLTMGDDQAVLRSTVDNFGQWAGELRDALGRPDSSVQ